MEPEGDPRTAAVTPAVLAMIGRELCRTGESMHIIEVRGGTVRLRPAGSWDVRGGPDSEDWYVRADLFGPSGNRTKVVAHAGVVHPRYAVDPTRPWLGVGPLQWATSTGALASNLERRLSEEAGGIVAHVLPVPQDPAEGALDMLRQDIAQARGGTTLVETTSAGWGEGRGAAPAADWRPQRIGANPPASIDAIRTSTGQPHAAACGVPPALVSRSDGTALREAWRQFLFGTISPVAKLLEAELSEKLDVSVDLVFNELRASDLAGRARAFQSMVGGGMEPAEAAALAGLMAD